MKCGLLLVGAVAVAIVPWTVAAIPTPYVTLTRVEGNQSPKGPRETHTFVGVQKGHLVVGQSPFETYDEKSENRWIIDGDHLRCAAGGYLAYDPEGKDPAVTVVTKPGKATVWMNRGVIRVGAGPMKGWYLDTEERTEQDGQGKTISVARLVLVKEAPSHLFRTVRVEIHK